MYLLNLPFGGIEFIGDIFYEKNIQNKYRIIYSLIGFNFDLLNIDGNIAENITLNINFKDLNTEITNLLSLNKKDKDFFKNFKTYNKNINRKLNKNLNHVNKELPVWITNPKYTNIKTSIEIESLFIFLKKYLIKMSN